LPHSLIQMQLILLLFTDNYVIYGFPVPLGPIWNHILGFWRRRHEPNILFLKYEDLKKVSGSVYVEEFYSHIQPKQKCHILSAMRN